MDPAHVSGQSNTQSSHKGVGSYSLQTWQAQTVKEDPWHGFHADGATDVQKPTPDQAVSVGSKTSMVAKAGSASTGT